MLNRFNSLNNIIKFIVCTLLLLAALFLFVKIYGPNIKNLTIQESSITKRTIEDKDDNYNIVVNYPRFHNNNLNKLVIDYVYNYIIDFKEESKNNSEIYGTLKMDYTLYFNENYLNIFFNINNSFNKKDKFKNILIDIENNKLAHISELYDEDLFNNIYLLANKKYSTYVYNKIKEFDINSFDFYINENYIDVFFEELNFDKKITYTPNIRINLTEEFLGEEYLVDENKKMVAFTFDDGPSEYTLKIVDALDLNNSKGTFFMLGNRMKYKKEVVKNVFDSGNEIGSHSYSHKNLTRISEKEILNQINSTTIIYKEITGDNIKYLRPPYGSINSRVIKLTPFPLITWSIDTKDWLYRDAEKISEHILSKVYDGAIILMHDTYPETVEALKIVIPKLKDDGYELVTISSLINYKDFELTKGKAIREIN